ncbi:hypothetical protein [Kaarinaea lacus]
MTFRQVYQVLFNHYGPQHWWPADSPFEVMVGSVLVQNTAWANVERAIINLKSNDCLSAQKILSTSEQCLADWIRPSGYFNIKAKRLRNFCRWYVDAGEYASVRTMDTSQLRDQLLSVNGVGPETADDILLYAFNRPVFVIDAYTRRLFGRLGLVKKHPGYEHLRAVFEESLPADSALLNEYHALIVKHAKEVCKKTPECLSCCLSGRCQFNGC